MKTFFASNSLFFLLLICGSFLSCTATKNIDEKSIPPNTVIMANTKFYPATITVSKGTTVTWKNEEERTHNATANDNSWQTGDMEIGSSKSVTFDKPGTYPYHCSRHAMLGMGMTGEVIVQ